MTITPLVTRALALTAAALLPLALPACRRPSSPVPLEVRREPPAPPAGQPREEHADHEQGEASDLDQPVEELFAATCEHGKKTHECDECRYEVGVVRAPERLFADGLLKRVAAERRRLETEIALTGEVRFDERRVAHLSAQVEGVIRKVHVLLGDTVRRGQPMVELESVAVGEAQAACLEARATLELARRTHERQVRLRKELISSEREYLQARQELDAAEIRLDAASGKLVRLGMDPAAVRALTPREAGGRLTLRAPADGVILAMHAVPGEVARPEEPLATVGDNSAVWVWANVYERDMAALRVAQSRRGLSARVAVRGYPDQEFPGTVDFVSPAMDEPSRTVRARVEVPNPRGLLLPGMFAKVRVAIPGEEEALMVPADAVLEDAGRSFLFLRHRGDYYVRRPVTRGRSSNGWVEIGHGLAGGESVVAEGAFLLKSDVLRSKMGAGCAD